MSQFSFTETEKDLIILGVSNIIRTENGVNTTFSINNFGDNSYKYNIIKDRIANNGSLDIHTLYTTHSSLLQSTYPQIYNIYNSNNTAQVITATTSYTI